jgi:hypothetical protein
MTRRIDVDASAGKETAMKLHGRKSIVAAFRVAGRVDAGSATAEVARAGDGAGASVDRGNAARIAGREILL